MIIYTTPFDFKKTTTKKTTENRLNTAEENVDMSTGSEKSRAGDKMILRKIVIIKTVLR